MKKRMSVFYGNRKIPKHVVLGNNKMFDFLSLPFYTVGEENKQPDEKSNGQGKLNQEDGHTLANPLSLSFYTEGEEDKQPDEISNGQGKLNQGDGRTIGKVFVSNREIGKGSNGTIVLEGTYEGRRLVAVKRLVKASQDVAGLRLKLLMDV